MQNRSRWWLAAAILLAWLPVVIPAARSAVWQWSETASSNASADPSINWREGQPPSSANDSARAMMAALASYRDDISGLLTTGGTSTVYTVTTNQGLCASPSTTPQDGQQLALTMSATNGTSPTLTADSCSAYPIQSSPAVAVPIASLIQGSPYTVRFSVANGAWMLRDFYGSAVNVPLGAMIDYTGTTVPSSNFVFPAGQCLSTTTYATYWTFLGSPASGSCSGGQFQIIDMSGRVAAGLDTMPGFTAKNRLTSASTGCGTAMTSVGASCANGGESKTLITANLPPYTPAGAISTSSALYQPTGGLVVASGVNFSLQAGGGSLGFTFAGTAQGGTSTPVASIPPTVGVTKLLRVL